MLSSVEQSNSMDRSPFSEAGRSSIKKFPAYYRTQRFITLCTKAYHWSISWARWIPSMPFNPVPFFFFLGIILTFVHPCLVLQVVSFLQVFKPKSVCISVLFSTCNLLWPSHPFLLDHPNNIWWGAEILKVLILQFAPASHYFLSQVKNTSA
jgi:hypothetical protein